MPSAVAYAVSPGLFIANAAHMLRLLARPAKYRQLIAGCKKCQFSGPLPPVDYENMKYGIADAV